MPLPDDTAPTFTVTPLPAPGLDRDVVVDVGAWRAVVAPRDDAGTPMSEAERRRVVVLLAAVPCDGGPAMFSVADPDGELVRLVSALNELGHVVVRLAEG